MSTFSHTSYSVLSLFFLRLFRSNFKNIKWNALYGKAETMWKMKSIRAWKLVEIVINHIFDLKKVSNTEFTNSTEIVIFYHLKEETWVFMDAYFYQNTTKIPNEQHQISPMESKRQTKSGKQKPSKANGNFSDFTHDTILQKNRVCVS